MVDRAELRTLEYSHESYTHILDTKKGKRIGIKRHNSFFVLGFMDGGKPIKEFNRSFMTAYKAYDYALQVVDKLEEEGRGKRVKKEVVEDVKKEVKKSKKVSFGS